MRLRCEQKLSDKLGKKSKGADENFRARQAGSLSVL